MSINFFTFFQKNKIFLHFLRKTTQLHASQIFIKIFIASVVQPFPVKIYPYNKYCYLGDTLYISKTDQKRKLFRFCL